jgi:Transposase DDE domain
MRCATLSGPGARGGCCPMICRLVQEQALRWQCAGCFENMAHDLRALLRLLSGRTAEPSAAIFDSRTLQSSPESGGRAGYDGYKRRNGSKLHAAVDILGHLLAMKTTPANEQDRAQVRELCARVKEVTGGMVEVGYADQGYTGAAAAADAAAAGIRLEVVKLAGKERLCAAAQTLGGGAQFGLGGALPPSGARLRAPRRLTRKPPLACLYLPHARLPL